MTDRMPIVVLISGFGSNLQAMIDAERNGASFTIRAVICNNSNAAGLQRAEQANIPTHIIDHRTFESREAFDRALMACIDQYAPAVVALAGFMRRLTPDFVEHYEGQLINMHPSLLPKYPGLDTHARALADGEREHGVSIHYVTAEVDSGPLIRQERLDIRSDDTPQTLESRIHALEHQLYPEVLEQLATNYRDR